MQAFVRAGLPPTRTVGEPGFHGPAGSGVQGIGVRTPSAAAVAAATVGLARLMHIPKGGMFVIGIMSAIDPIGLFSAIARAWGRTTSADGATPKLHIRLAPSVTNKATPELSAPASSN